MVKFASQKPQQAAVDASGVLGAIVTPGQGIYTLRMNTATDNPMHAILQDSFGALPTEMYPRSSRIEDGHVVFTCEIERLPELGNITFDLVVMPGAFIAQNAKGQRPRVEEPKVEEPVAVGAPAPQAMKERPHVEVEDPDEDLKMKLE